MKDVNQTNFKEGQVWLSRNKNKFRIVSVERENPLCWYPILLENVVTKILFTAAADGEIYQNFQHLDDRLVMQVPGDFDVTSGEKSIADRMLRVYNKKKQDMERERKKDNDHIKRILGIVKKDRT